MSEKQKDIVKSSPDKPGFMQRVSKFLKEYRGELKKISWPTMAEVVKNTMITLAAVLMIGVVIWVFDYAVTSLRDILITSDKASASDVVSDSTAADELAASIADVVSDTEAAAVSIADAISNADANAQG
ncbi:MAG: preprotein translocase subunit SecE [Ruminococcaceae bacterium]|nr:preprotein translocase subunit SecE [Oscillospiraceae bacterium]